MADVFIVVISGRELQDLRRKVGVEGLTYAASHGLHVMHPNGETYEHAIPQDYKVNKLACRSTFVYGQLLRLCVSLASAEHKQNNLDRRGS
mgnify:FL=1